VLSSVLGDTAVRLAPVVGEYAPLAPLTPQHPVEQRGLVLPSGGVHLLAQVLERLGHLHHLVGSSHFAEVTVEVFGQDFTFLGADLSEVHHVALVPQEHHGDVLPVLAPHVLDGLPDLPNVVETRPISNGVDEHQPI